MTNRNRRFILSSTLASIFVTASASAIALSDTNSLDPKIRDIRIGERGLQSRIALFCDTECLPEAVGDGEYFLPGSGDAFNLDLSSASDRIAGLRAINDRDGSRLSVTFTGTLEKTSATPCTVGGKAASCLDLYFADDSAEDDAISVREALRDSVAERTPSQSQTVTGNEDQFQGGQMADAPEEADVAEAEVAPAPGLRETSSDRLQVFAKLAPPERLAPPEVPILAKVQPIEASVDVGTPTLRQTETLAPTVKADYADRVSTLLGKQLTPAYCNNASATLQADAWALGAMVDMGLCAAARGDAVEAESILSRVLEYTPDNYEALVGRALIAEQAGEKGAALRYYQDALDAPPPVEESTRIVEAMAALARG